MVEAHLENASSAEGRDTGQMVRPPHYLHLHSGRHGFRANDGIIACPNTTAEDRGSSTVKRIRTESSQAVQGDCYKCHQPGHWANACPNEGGVVHKQRRGGGKSSSSTRARGGTKRARGPGGGSRGKRGRGSLSKTGSFAAADDWE